MTIKKLSVSGQIGNAGYVDISKTFVEIARRNAVAEGVEAQFAMGNAAALPAVDASDDFVVPCGVQAG